MKPESLALFRRRVTMSAGVVVVLALAYFFMMYGSWTVLHGMDTMPDDYPVGATCIIRKNPSDVPVGSVVVLALPGEAVLLSRVIRVEGDRIFIRHDNQDSVFCKFEEQSYPQSDVRGLVLTALLPDPVSPGVARGK